MKITQDILKQYARLIVRSGANVQQGQTVLLYVAVDQAAFAEMKSEWACQAATGSCSPSMRTVFSTASQSFCTAVSASSSGKHFFAHFSEG